MDQSKNYSLYVFATVLLIATYGVAAAEDRGPIDQNVEISLGGFVVTNTTRVRLDGQNGQTGTDVNWEHDLGLNDANRFRVDGFWRFAQRHKVRFMYFRNDRSASRTLTRDIVFDGTTYPVNAEVNAELDTQIVELAYEYAFVRNDNWDVSAGIGIHNVKVSAALGGSISTTGGGVSSQSKSDASTNGPLPVLSIHVLWHIGGNFYFDGLGQYFKANIDNVDGRLSDYKLAATWYPIRNAGIGVGYDKFSTSVDINKNDFTGTLRTTYGGPMVFLTASF
jgi:hypothetical protein